MPRKGSGPYNRHMDEFARIVRGITLGLMLGVALVRMVRMAGRRPASH